jgi:predicted nucleic-acid-binding protein
MIGIDTNVLVRVFLDDDKEQAQRARAFLLEATEKSKLFISSYALLEFVWVLKTKNFTRKEIYDALMTLIDVAGVTIGSREVVINATEKYIKGNADFGDYMIMAEGEKHGSRFIKSFDKTVLKEHPHASAP